MIKWLTHIYIHICMHKQILTITKTSLVFRTLSEIQKTKQFITKIILHYNA